MSEDWKRGFAEGLRFASEAPVKVRRTRGPNKRTLTPEHLAAMKAGREKAKKPSK